MLSAQAETSDANLMGHSHQHYPNDVSLEERLSVIFSVAHMSLQFVAGERMDGAHVWSHIDLFNIKIVSSGLGMCWQINIGVMNKETLAYTKDSRVATNDATPATTTVARASLEPVPPEIVAGSIVYAAGSN